MLLHKSNLRTALLVAALLVWPAGIFQAAQQGTLGRRSRTTGRRPTGHSLPAMQVTPPTQDPETEKVDPPPAGPTRPATLSETGSMGTTEVRALLKSLISLEFRINDLLTDVHPERWKLSGATLDSFNQTLKTLRVQMTALEDWRAQFDQRTDSMYLGFETYAALDAVLPRLNGVAQSLSEHESPGYAAQLSRAGDQLFDLQQTIGTYVGSLLQNQDQLLRALENNVGACQQNLSAAMRGRRPPAKRMKNTRAGRAQRRSSRK